MGKRHIAIVGGGAAGFFAAITAAEASPDSTVTIFEATAHLLAKVKVSGGGRCNVTHACFEPRELVQRYPRGARELLGAFNRWQPRDTVEWFEARGVKLKAEADGRMFPVTDNSQTIVDCLIGAAQKAGVVIRTNCGVKSVDGALRAPSNETARGAHGPPFQLTLTTGETVAADRLLLATGGNRASAAFAIAAQFGHTIEPPVPSLFTPQFVRMTTPAFCAAPIRQSTIVCELSVTGNIRPSASVFSFTPRASNHSPVSRGCQRLNAPSSSRAPRG